MKIPSRVKIGGIVYKVEILDDWPTRDGYDGECFNDKEHGNTIKIWAGLSQQAQEITLIHEAMHAMNTVMAHEFLDSFSEQLYQFLHDNKLLR